MIRRIAYLCQLFPKNYFLSNTKKDEFISSNWRNLPINILGKYNNEHSECDDILHQGNKIGNGVYVSPNIETAKYYSGTIVIKGKKYLTLFLVKVKKDSIRKCNCPNASDHWVLRGTNQEIRPVSVLLSEL